MKLDPYKLFFRYNADHLVGYDNALGDFVVLRLDRIIKLSLRTSSFIIRSSLVIL